MKQLSGERAWEYSFKTKVEDEIERLRDAIEIPEGRTLEQYHYLGGQIEGLRIALKAMREALERFKLDDDAD